MTSFDKAVLHFARLDPSGLSPKAPGTAGSFFAVLLAPFLFLPFSLPVRLALLAVIFVLGALAATRAEKLLSRKDPGCIVIDELVGQWLAMLFLAPFSASSTWHDALFLLVPFVFFRIFDILKPWPVHASESWLPAGWGIMIDDVFAGLWALICTCLFHLALTSLFPGCITL
ncbi:MAG: phosphatidylglycerophosphatase A [Mailhella sp.]|nr:phosphatidylglycerophosphatase A [Mailhella sp.]MBQ8743857.1 phosphatidylglycerophosphatase A [Mailhella sp.]